MSSSSLGANFRKGAGVPAKPRLGIFSLGVAAGLYFTVQYLLIPISYWLWYDRSTSDSVFALIVYSRIEAIGIDVTSTRAFGYAIVGLVAFLLGYAVIPKRGFVVMPNFIYREWPPSQVMPVYLIFFSGGFLLKFAKLAAGVPIPPYYDTLLGNPTLSWILSFNWLHLIALGVILVGYFHARFVGHKRWRQFRAVAYGTLAFVVGFSLVGGSDMATIIPILIFVVARQFYYPIKFLKLGLYILIFAAVEFIGKDLITSFIQLSAGDSRGIDEWSALKALLSILIARVNMSHVFTTIVEGGAASFSEGTLSQFFVDLGIWSPPQGNVLDGNVFGRTLGLILPEDYMTGVATTNIGDYFINFGLAGIVLGMMFNGVAYKVIQLSFGSIRAPGAVLAFSMLWPILIHGMESPVSALYANAIKMLALVLVVHGIILLKLVPSGTYTYRTVT